MVHHIKIHTADDIALHITDYEGGKDRHPLVALPGITRNGRDFQKFAETISPQERVITVDFRGRGNSDWDPNYRNYHPATYVHDVLAVLTAMNLHNIVLIGSSLGGLVSMGLAMARPACLKGVILNDIGPAVHPDGIKKLATMFEEQPAFDSFDHAAQVFKQRWGHAFPTEDEHFWLEFAHNVCSERDSAVRPSYDPGIGRAVLERVGATDADPWEIWRAMFNIPTLLIHGLLSEFLSSSIVEEMKQKKPDLNVLTLADRGHTPTLTEPQSLTHIQTFLDQVNNAPV